MTENNCTSGYLLLIDYGSIVTGSLVEVNRNLLPINESIIVIITQDVVLGGLNHCYIKSGFYSLFNNLAGFGANNDIYGVAFYGYLHGI